MRMPNPSPLRLLVAALFFVVGVYLMTRPGAPAVPGGWNRVQAGPVSFALPPDFRQNPLHAIAGEVGQWSSRRGIIGYNLSPAALSPAVRRSPDREEVIDGRKVRIMTQQDPGGLVEMEARFPIPGAREMNLLLWGPEAGLEREFLSVVRSVSFEH